MTTPRYAFDSADVDELPIDATEAVRLAGEEFTAHCPAGAAWYDLQRRAKSDTISLESDGADEMFALMFSEQDREEITKLLAARRLTFYALDQCFKALIDLWLPLVRAAFGEEDPKDDARRPVIPAHRSSRPRPAKASAAKGSAKDSKAAAKPAGTRRRAS